MAEGILKPPVSGTDDHVLGTPAATPGVGELVEYGDFQCPHCARAVAVIQQLLVERPDRLRFAFRHFPLTRLHPLARRAAEASEAAGGQDAFWPMHDLLFARAPALAEADLLAYAKELGLDTGRLSAELSAGTWAERVQRDVGSAARSGVNGTPTFFVNGKRHNGAYTLDALRSALDGPNNEPDRNPNK